MNLKCALFMALFLTGCSDRGAEPIAQGPGVPVTVSFSGDIQPVFDANCVACHGAAGNGNLDLRPGLAWDNLIGVASSGYAEVRVDPGNPEESLLYLKLTGAAGAGPRMPAGGALEAAAIESFRVWIQAGAPDN